jgi:hypothetical protein
MLDKKETEQLVNVKFLVKLKKSVTDAYHLLRDVYREDGRITKSTVNKMTSVMLQGLKGMYGVLYSFRWKLL